MVCDGVMLFLPLGTLFKDALINKNSSVSKGTPLRQLALIYSEGRILANHHTSFITVSVVLWLSCFCQGVSRLFPLKTQTGALAQVVFL